MSIFAALLAVLARKKNLFSYLWGLGNVVFGVLFNLGHEKAAFVYLIVLRCLFLGLGVLHLGIGLL